MFIVHVYLYQNPCTKNNINTKTHIYKLRIGEFILIIFVQLNNKSASKYLDRERMRSENLIMSRSKLF